MGVCANHNSKIAGSGGGSTHAGVAGAGTGSGHRPGAAAGGDARPATRTGRAPGRGGRVRRVPHRPARRRRRARRAPPVGGARPRGGRPTSRPVGPAPARFAAGRPGRRGVAAGDLRRTAASAGRAGRTCARARGTPAGTPTAATPSTPSSRATSPTPLPDGVRREPSWRRCSAPGSSATGRCAAPSCHPAAGSASTGSARSAHLTAQVAIAEGADRSCAHPRRARPAAGAGAGRGVARATRTTCRPSRSTPPILFAPVGDLVPAGAGGPGPRRHAGDRRHPPQRHPGAELPPRTCSRNGRCAASRPTPVRTAGRCWTSRRATACEWRPRRTRWRTRTPR